MTSIKVLDSLYDNQIILHYNWLISLYYLLSIKIILNKFNYREHKFHNLCINIQSKSFQLTLTNIQLYTIAIKKSKINQFHHHLLYF